jgi:hypothetical protein
MYTAIFTCRVSRYSDGTTAVSKGTRIVPVKDEYGITGQRYDPERPLPLDIVSFNTEKEAEDWAFEWEGHPWYFKTGVFKIIGIVPAYERVHVGWEEV